MRVPSGSAPRRRLSLDLRIPWHQKGGLSRAKAGTDGGVCRAGPGCVLFLDTGTHSCIGVAKCDWPTQINISRWRFREGGGEKRKRREGPHSADQFYFVK